MQEAFAAGGNKTELIEDESTNGGVSGILWNGDAVLSVEIANVQGSIEDEGTVRKRERVFDDVEFVVNFADDLFEDVFEINQAEQAAKFVDDNGHTGVAVAQLVEQFAGGLGFRNDKHFAQNAAQIEWLSRQIFGGA